MAEGLQPEFAVPPDADALLENDAGAFAVANYREPADISEYNQLDMIDETAQRLTDPWAIVDNDNFDALYSFTRHFADLADNVKSKLWKMLCTAIRTFAKELSREIEEIHSGTARGHHARNAVKMYTYLVHVVAMAEESAANSATKHLGNAKTKENRAWSWDMQRKNALAAFGQLVDLDIPKLWQMACPEEPYVSLMTRFAYLCLENQAVVRDKDARTTLIDLIGVLVQKFNHGLSAATSIVHLLPHFEHLSAPLAELLEALCNTYDAQAILAEVLRDIGRKDSHEFVRDASGARYTSAFLVEVGERLPGACLTSFSLLAPLLDCESYTMRNAVVSVTGSIVGAVLLQDRTDTSVKTRNQMLDILEERILDVSAYTRKQALLVWQTLADRKAIPLRRLTRVVQAIVERLEDKSSMVRKQALLTLASVMQRNPFGSQLNAIALSNTLDDEKRKLEALLDAGLQSAEAVKAIVKAEAKEAAAGAEEGAEDNNDSAEADEEDTDAAEAVKAEKPDEASSTTEAEAVAELTKQQVVTQYLQDATAFARTVAAAVPLAAQLLGSKTASDAAEAINFLVVAHQFGVEGVNTGIRKMLALIWSKESSIKNAVLAAYRALFFTPDPEVHTTPKDKHGFVVRNLMHLTAGATLGDLKCMEELVNTMLQEKAISPHVVKMLWDIFAQKHDAPNVEHSRRAVVVLGMMARADDAIVKEHVGLLVSVGLGELAEKDLHLAAATCEALQRVVETKADKFDKSEPVRFPQDHAMMKAMAVLLEKTFAQQTKGWVPAAEQAVNTIYLLAERPDAICSQILHTISGLAFAPPSDDANADSAEGMLTKLLFFAGHVALKQLVHTEVVMTEMKRRRTITEEQQHKRKQAGKKGKAGDEDEDMGVGGASAEDAEADFMYDVCETELLLSGRGLLGVYMPLVVAVCHSPSRFQGVALQSAAVLTLTKFMCTSSQVCDQHLQLLFTLLKTSKHAKVRSNAIIALGDLAFRFPNLIEPWTPHLYGPLRDTEESVRKNTVMVLTHLILNDMIKVKGQISELALRLEDPIQRIADLTRLFFFELAQKGNAIYNILPDIISQVAEPTSGADPVQFRTIMSYLFSFIQKDKQAEGLIEKLCQRFKTTVDAQQWRHFAYCLSLLSFSDKGIRRLIEQFSCFHDKLGDAEIYASFQEIMTKAKKFAKTEMKEALAELEQRIDQCHEKGAEDNAVASAAAKATKKMKRTGRVVEQVDDQSDAENEKPNVRAPPSTTKKSRGRKGGRKSGRGAKAKEQNEDSDASLGLSGDEIADLNVEDLLASDDEAAPVAKGRSRQRAGGRQRGVSAR